MKKICKRFCFVLNSKCNRSFQPEAKMAAETIKITKYEDSPYPFIAKLTNDDGNFYGIGETEEEAEKSAREIAQNHQERLFPSESKSA